MTELEMKLGYTFKNSSLLETALTHSSFANEHKEVPDGSNERLEFLGDSVLGMIVAEYLFKTYPDLPEGKMTRMRAELVCEQNLYRVACDLELGKKLRLGHGEKQNGGDSRPSILADAVEAVIAAIFLEGGQKEAKKLIDRYILAPIENGKKVASSDYKTALQEHVQKKHSQTLEYVLTDVSGPQHERQFSAMVMLNGICAGTGSGRSKKEAEQAAARCALEGLGSVI